MIDELIDYKISDADVVTNPVLHDAKVLCIDLNIDVKIDFQLTTGEVVNVELICPKHFVCNDLFMGNIVLDLTVSSGEKISDADKNNLFGRGKIPNEKFDQYINGIEQELLNRNLCIVKLNPSYGCKFIAICKNIVFTKKMSQ